MFDFIKDLECPYIVSTIRGILIFHNDYTCIFLKLVIAMASMFTAPGPHLRVFFKGLLFQLNLDLSLGYINSTSMLRLKGD